MQDKDDEYIPRPPQEVILETGELSDWQLGLIALVVFLAMMIGAGISFYQMFKALPLRQ